MEMGFTIDQANTALKQTNGNLNEAVDALVNGNVRFNRDRGYGQGGRDRDQRMPLREDRRENVRGQYKQRDQYRSCQRLVQTKRSI